MDDHLASSRANTLANPDIDRFEQWAPSYDGSILQWLFFTRVHTRMLDLIQREAFPDSAPECAVDVGCGTGRLLRAAARRWPQARLLGADPAELMVAEARRLSPGIAVSLAAAESLPFPDESADIVTSSLSFHHWADQEKAVGEIARVLRPGGFFCLADHTFLPAKASGERPMSRRQVRELMERTGLTVRRQRWAQLPFILITLTRK